MSKLKTLKNQAGIGIGAIIGIVALLAVLGAVIASSLGGGSNNTSSEQDKLNASAILMQSGSLKDGMDLLVAKEREATYGTIILDFTATAPNFALYHPTDGTLEYLVPPKAAFSAGTAEWVKDATRDLNGDAKADIAVKVSTLATPVCSAINEALGLTYTSTPITTGRTAFCDAGVYWKVIQVVP